MIGSALLGTVGMVDVIAGLSWEPEIRGLLTVALAMAILGGSVWLLLVTNTGTRLGSLIALAGFWGWMFVMGIFWWIYGIGWVGSSPTWQIEDVFIDPAGAEVTGLQDAFVGNVDLLPDGNCFNDTEHFPPPDGVASVSLEGNADIWAECTPRAVDLLMAYTGESRNLYAQDFLNPQTPEGRLEALAQDMFGVTGDDAQAVLDQLSRDQQNELFDAQIAARIAEIEDAGRAANELLGPDDPRYLEGEALQEKLAEDVDNAMLRIDQISLSQLEAVAPTIEHWAEEEGLLRLQGWNLQSTAEAGEATATADAFLREELFPDGNFLVLDAFQEGGKPKRDGNGIWDRISHKVTSTLRITHPTNYTVINVQQTIEKIADPAKPPPVPEIDPAEPTYSVVMIRDLGNKRLIPALFTIVSLILFLTTCLVLHWRDLGLREKGLDV